MPVREPATMPLTYEAIRHVARQWQQRSDGVGSVRMECSCCLDVSLSNVEHVHMLFCFSIESQLASDKA